MDTMRVAVDEPVEIAFRAGTTVRVTPHMHEALTRMRAALIATAHAGATTSYGALMAATGEPYLPQGLGRVLDVLTVDCARRCEPSLAALVVRRAEGEVGDGFTGDAAAERNACWRYWGRSASSGGGSGGPSHRPVRRAMNGEGVFSVSGGRAIPMVSAAFASEAELQQLIEDHPDLLAGQQIDPDNPRRGLLIAREQGVPAFEGGGSWWSVDHLFVDQDGIPTLAEVKRSSDTRLRREVVGQCSTTQPTGCATGRRGSSVRPSQREWGTVGPTSW